MSDNIREMTDKLRALIAEREECNKIIAQAEVAKKRLDELNDGAWSGTAGEITMAKRALSDAKLPRVPSGYRAGEVIMAVDSKFVTIRCPGAAEKFAAQYRRSDGKEKGSRGDWRTSVDVDSIVQAWDAHHSSIGQDE
jgi:hypothetical protein